MTISFANGQGSGGKGLLVTAITAGTAQTLHTAVAGTATADVMGLYAVNNSDAGVDLTLVFTPEDGSDAVTLTETIPAHSGFYQMTNQLKDVAVPLNDTMVVTAYASVASALTVWGVIDNQADRYQAHVLETGHATVVQNASRFRMNGLVADATEANHQLVVPVAGILANFSARARAAIAATSAITATVRVNGADTTLTLDFLPADTTDLLSIAGPVTVAAGDLVTIAFTETANLVNPATDFFGSVEFFANIA